MTGAICSWGHGIITWEDLRNHQICGACMGDEPFYIVRKGVTDDTVRCMFCVHQFNDHKRARLWVDQTMDYIRRLECKVEGCACNHFRVHPTDEGGK